MKNVLNIAIAIICFTFLSLTSVSAQINVLSDNSVGIGSSSTSSSELLVKTNNEYYSLYAQNVKTSGNRYSFRNYVSSGSTGRAYGILSYVYQKSTATGETRGISTYTYGRGSGRVYGYYNYLYNYGVTNTTYGSYNYLNGDAASTGTKYGVYSAVYGQGTKYAGFFIGNIYVSGGVLLWTPKPNPDQKQGTVTNALSKLTSVNTFATATTANGKQKTTYTLDPGTLKQAFPELVVEVDRSKEADPRGISEKEVLDDKEPGKDGSVDNGKEAAVDINGLIPVLVEAIKEQQKEIESLKAQIKAQ